MRLKALLMLLTLSATGLLANVDILATQEVVEPTAVYGTISTYDSESKIVTLLEGAIRVDVSRAYVVDKSGRQGPQIMPGLQAKIILKPGPASTPLEAALVELASKTPASIAGPVQEIDLGAMRFVAAGLSIYTTAETKWRGGADVRSLQDLEVRHNVNVDLVRVEDRLVATDIFVVGFIPRANHTTFGKVVSVEGDIWIVRDTAGNTHVFKVFERTTMNSGAIAGAEPKVGEYVRVTSYPDEEGVEIAYVITVVAPPSEGAALAMFGTLLEVNEEQGYLSITGEGNARVEFAITEATGFYLGAKIGDYVEVRAENRRVDGRLAALQVIKTLRTVRISFQGTVQAINGDRWLIDGWTITVTPQTILINNPRVGDVVRVVGEGERTSRSLVGISIERL